MMTIIFCFTAFFSANFGGFTDTVMDINMDGWTDRPPIIDVRTHLKTSQGSSFIFAKQGVKNNIFETFSTNNSNDLHFKRLTFLL